MPAACDTIISASGDLQDDPPESALDALIRAHNQLAGEKYLTGRIGFGVRSRRQFSPGDVVMVFHGPVHPPEKVQDFDLCLQLSPTEFMDSAGDIDDYVNHSCNPNTVLAVKPFSDEQTLHCLAATRPIRPGDAITFDYSITMSGGYWKMKCACGSEHCRQVVDDLTVLPPNEQARLKELIQANSGEAILLSQDARMQNI